MKNQIYFTIAILILSATMAILTGCTQQSKPLDQRPVTHELIVKKGSNQHFVGAFTSADLCAIAGMPFKNKGYSFECESLNTPQTECTNLDYIDDTFKCLEKRKQFY